MKIAMTIAGSDPSGGAGLQADIKTIHAHGVFATSVVTLLTVQNTLGVDDVRVLEPDFVLAQLDAVVKDLPPTAAKTGALGSAAMIEAIVSRASQFAFPLVVDPVMISKHGHTLIDDDAIEVLREQLLPHAFLVTPNVMEASQLAKIDVTDAESMVDAAKRIADLGAQHVLIKGGKTIPHAMDILWTPDGKHELRGEYFDTDQTHGSGCVLSAAITARLALGDDVLAAVSAAKKFITRAIGTAPGLGSGNGPVNMHASLLTS